MCHRITQPDKSKQFTYMLIYNQNYTINKVIYCNYHVVALTRQVWARFIRILVLLQVAMQPAVYSKLKQV